MVGGGIEAEVGDLKDSMQKRVNSKGCKEKKE